MSAMGMMERDELLEAVDNFTMLKVMKNIECSLSANNIHRMSPIESFLECISILETKYPIFEFRAVDTMKEELLVDGYPVEYILHLHDVPEMEKAKELIERSFVTSTDWCDELITAWEENELLIHISYLPLYAEIIKDLIESFEMIISSI